MARRSAVGRGRDTAVVEETAAPGRALSSSVDPWDPPGGDRRGRSGGGGRGGGRWSGSGGRWWVWAGRAVLWAVIIVILVNGIRAPFERFTADETSGGPATTAKPPRGAGFPSSAAGAFALQFADVYLNFDQNGAAAREAQLRTFLPDGADPQFGWNGAGKMQVQSIQVAGVDARDANNATVTLLARNGEKWLRLAVPVYADRGGSLVVSARPRAASPARQGAAARERRPEPRHRARRRAPAVPRHLLPGVRDRQPGGPVALLRRDHHRRSRQLRDLRPGQGGRGAEGIAGRAHHHRDRRLASRRRRRRRTGADLPARHGEARRQVARPQHPRDHATGRIMRGPDLSEPTPSEPADRGR